MSKQLVDNMSRLTTAFHTDPENVTIIGIDTEHKNILEHPLFDGERNSLPLREETIQNFIRLGCREPITIEKDGDYPAIVVDGRQRVRYLREANRRRVDLGLAPLTLPVVVNKNTKDSLLIAESLNTHRFADDILTKADRALGMESQGIAREDIMNSLGGVSESTVKNFVKLGQAAQAVRSALRDGLISPATAYRLARIKGKAEQKAALDEILTAPELEPKDKVMDSIQKLIRKAVKLGLGDNRIAEAVEWGIAEGKKDKKKAQKKEEQEEETA